MTAVQTDTRHTLYDHLGRHNRRIGVLRWAVPLAGAALLSMPLGQFLISLAAPELPIAGLRLENDTLVIDAPRFEGRTATGTVYRMTAERAESRVGDLDVADLYGLAIDMTGEGGYQSRARFTSAQWTMSTEVLTSNEDVIVSDSTGAQGLLAGVEVDWPAQIITSEGPVRFTFDGGSQLDAGTMLYDMDAGLWRFAAISLDMTPAEDAGAERNPHVTESGR